ncbi:MAG: hypothetical protein V4557_05545 [Bacteroidota bacterium]
MRKIILLCLVVFPCTFVLSQSKHGIGIYTSLFNTGSNFEFGGRMGGSSIQIENASLVGVEYNRGLNKWLKVSIGVEYSRHRGYEHYISGSGTLVVNHGYIQHITLPLYLRADFWKYFFFTFGTIIDLEAKSDLDYKHSNIGITGGTGFKYDFKNKITVFVHPFYELHGTSSGSLITGGLRTGISFRF